MADDTDRTILPRNIDPARLGERDNPESDWGEPEAGAVHGVNHVRRAVLPEERVQGAKTRAANKDQVSRRS
jgi:hypothetical protein